MKDLINKIRSKLDGHREYQIAALVFQGALIGALAVATAHCVAGIP